jgi:hypothetical protein
MWMILRVSAKVPTQNWDVNGCQKAPENKKPASALG